MSTPKTLLITAHAPSDNTAALANAALAGAQDPEIAGVSVRLMSPFDTGPEDVLAADGLILGTTENLGYMAGATKDFFDRCYYPCLEKTQGLPVAVYIRAGHDGTGTQRALKTIMTGLRWRPVMDPVVLKGAWDPGFTDRTREVGMALAAGLEAGVF